MKFILGLTIARKRLSNMFSLCAFLTADSDPRRLRQMPTRCGHLSQSSRIRVCSQKSTEAKHIWKPFSGYRQA